MVSALFNFGAAPFDAFFPRCPRDSLDSTPEASAAQKALLASLSLIVSATCAAPLQRRLGVVGACITGLSLSALGLAGVAATASASLGGPLSSSARLALFWVACSVYQLGVPLYGPTVPTMLLQCVPRHRRGAMMGLDSSINTVARIVSAPLLGALWHAGGPGACFATASAVMLLSAATLCSPLVGASRLSDHRNDRP